MSENAYDRAVFVNCPFDAEYRSLFDALIFVILDCGFQVRTALDMSDSSQVRIAKLYDIIRDSRLAVHDLSRVELSPASLPRFNMPLEFGVFLGAKVFGDAQQARKACLVFDRDPYRYQAYISDIAGQDIDVHGGDPRLLVRSVRNWLATVADEPLPSSTLLWSRYETFRAELPTACHPFKQDPTDLTYREYVNQVGRFRVLKQEKLNLGEGTPITDPDPNAIARALSGLQPKLHSYAIYVRGGNGSTYMQTARNDTGFVLEYQDGSVEHHFQSVEQTITLERTIDVFRRYARGDNTWKTDFQWRKLNLHLPNV